MAFGLKPLRYQYFPSGVSSNKVVHGCLATLNQVEIGNQDAEQRTDKRPSIRGVMNKFGELNRFHGVNRIEPTAAIIPRCGS